MELIDLQPSVLQDLRGEPTTECVCGSELFYALVGFDRDTRLVGWYALDLHCAECGTLCTAPTPVDNGREV